MKRKKFNNQTTKTDNFKGPKKGEKKAIQSEESKQK
jgi:hypothetical protein